MDSPANILQVTFEILCILWSYMNDRIIKEQDTALNRKIVGGKKSMEQLAGSHNVFTSEIIALTDFTCQLRLIDHSNITLTNRKRLSIIDKTPFPHSHKASGRCCHNSPWRSLPRRNLLAWPCHSGNHRTEESENC